MHIPDGFIDAKTAVTTAALSATAVGMALRQVRKELPPRRVPLLGLGAAFLFAAQMVNFPVLGGTSGHLVGGLLMAALLGPAASIVVMTTVLIVQSFLFADGGVLALGANTLNMAVVGGAGAYGIFRFVSGVLPGTQGRVAAVAFAGWCSTMMAAVCCAGQLAWSGTAPWGPTISAMAGVHAIIGIGEGLISALVFLAIERTRPELIASSAVSTQGAATPSPAWLSYAVLAVLAIAVFLAPFASPLPDGLESVASRLGFEHSAQPNPVPAPAADYQIPGFKWSAGSTAAAGLVGVLFVFGLAVAMARWLVRRPGSKVKAA